MRKLLLLSLLFLTGCTQIGATRTFVSEQVGDNPQNGYILSTNGATSTWIANSGGPGGDSTIDSTEVAFGSPDNTVTSSANFTFNSSTNQLSVSSITSTSVTSTNLAVYSTSTFYNDIVMTHAHFLTTHGIKGDASDGMFITANNDTAVANFGVGNSANSTFNGGVNIDGQTRLATSLTGLAYLTSGVVSAITTSSLGFLTVETDPIWTSASTSYLRLDGGTMTGGLQFINATTTGYFVSRTSTIQGGFFQTGLSTCNADGETLAYNATTGKFECGDDDSGGAASVSVTETLIPYGDVGNTLTSSTSFYFTSSTNALNVDKLLASNIQATSVSTSIIRAPGVTISFGPTDGMSLSMSAITNAITPVSDGLIDFGSSGLRFDDVYLYDLFAYNVTTTNLSATGTLFSNSLSFTNATGTGQLRIATTTITGGFFQTDLANCTGDTDAVSYNATTGKFGCGDDDTGGSGSSLWTDAGFYTYLTSSTSDLAIGNTTTSSAPFWWDVSATTSYVGNGGAGDSSIQVGPDTNAWIFGFDDTDDSFVISSSTILGTNNALSIAKGSLDVTVGGLLFTRATGTSVTSTNLSVSSLTSLAGLTFTNATGTGQFRIATTTITGGFNQTGLADCDTASSTIIYDLTTQKLSCQTKGKTSYTNIYTASTTWTKPVTSTGFVGVYAWCVGGGGGGGGAGTNNTIGGGGAGGGGAYEYLSASDLSATSSVTVTVGVGGTGGAAGNNNGVAGGTSSFGNFITCPGGGLGVAANAAETTAAGGVGSGGNVNGTGGYAGPNGAYTDTWRGYGGAACVNQNWPTTVQDAFSPNVTPGGILGQWCGAGAARSPSWSAANYTGGQGASFGAGGGGGQRVTGDVAGGDGRQGVVVIIELYN